MAQCGIMDRTTAERARQSIDYAVEPDGEQNQFGDEQHRRNDDGQFWRGAGITTVGMENSSGGCTSDSCGRKSSTSPLQSPE